jgi:hypothetical protein
VSLQALEVRRYGILQFDAYRVVPSARLYHGHLITRPYDALAEEKTECQILVIARGAHRNRHAACMPLTVVVESETNLERFLDSDPVGPGFAQVCAVSLELDGSAAACHLLLFRRHVRAVYRSHAGYRI